MRRRVPLAVLLVLGWSITWPVTGPPSIVAATPRDATARGDDPPPIGRKLRINEVDYDQPGFDTGEFVEIANTSERRYRLRGTALVFVNGTTSAEYRRVRLSGRLGPSRLLAVASAGVEIASKARSLPLPLARDNVQNGAPDAVALVDVANGVVLDAISYEGGIGEATFTDIAGTFDLVQGSPVSEADSNVDPGSLCRSPHGADSGDDDHDWTACAATPGAKSAGG
ncbi:MAG: lamin tail domain-containing protein [Actinomycetota bacterium]